MTRVGMLCHRGVGGSARVAVELSDALGRRGHDVHLLARSAPLGVLRPGPGVTLHLLDRGSSVVDTSLDLQWSTSEVDAFTDLVCSVAVQEHLDVLHFHYGVPFAVVAEAVRQRLGPVAPALVGTLHGSDISVLGARLDVRRVLAPVLASLDALTTVSHHHAVLAAGVFGLDEPPCVIPNFIDQERYRPGAPRPRASRPRIAHVSNLRPIKQPESMARIMAEVLARTDAELWIVGDGEGMPAVAELLAPCIASGQVRRLGVRIDVENVLPNVDLLLVTSSMESFCLVAIEALACGVPVVAPRVGGLPEVVEHGRCGLLYEPHDEGQAVRLVLDHLADEEQHSAMVEASRTRASAFATASVVPRYEQLYRQVLARGRALATSPHRR